jgi:hypothetical protein
MKVVSGVDVEPLTDVSPGSWLSDHLTSLGGRVRDVVPASYDAFVLITHRGDDDGGPPIGCLDRVSLAVLRDVLVRHTKSPEIGWFALWEGHPGLPRRWQAIPKLQLPDRSYVLFRAPVGDVVELAIETEFLGYSADVQGSVFWAIDSAGRRVDVDMEVIRQYAEDGRAAGRVRSPNLWWPDDRAWVVGTDIDGDVTVVACSQAVAAALLTRPDLYAHAVAADDPVPPGD